MGKHIHRLSDKDFENLTAVCANCGPVDIAITGNSYRCKVAHLEHRSRIKKDRKGTYQDLKKDYCENCGFQAQHRCQLDLDHVNGDRTDHRPENLQTLCANCHRLKSYQPALYFAPTPSGVGV